MWLFMTVVEILSNTGARYHQTREGGSIHTDNVNVSSRWKYMILSCLRGQVEVRRFWSVLKMFMKN